MEENKKEYTKEEIQNMSYWELWGVRRTAGVKYYLLTFAIYTFLLYCFIKLIYIFASKHFENGFQVDPWIIPICLITGPLFYYLHEWYYKNKFQNKK